MKRFLKIFLSVMMICLASAGFAQDKSRQNKGDWMEKMKAEKIAYLTDYMDLTSAEAEKFWPVYNQAEKEKGDGFRKNIEYYKALETAINENKSDEEVQKALDNYLTGQQQAGVIDKQYAEKYRKILPAQKVAKLYLGEEKFRREQIHRLHRPAGENANKNNNTAKNN